MNPCANFFEQHAGEQDKAALLQKSGNAIVWESLSASPHSPGPVQSSEEVLRVVINPIHIDEVGGLSPTLFSDVKRQGGSVHRLNFIEREAAINMGHAQALKKNSERPDAPTRSVLGTVRLPVERVRKVLVATSQRAFGVHDTAKASDQSHADIFQLIPDKGQEARSARLQLLEIAESGYEPLRP